MREKPRWVIAASFRNGKRPHGELLPHGLRPTPTVNGSAADEVREHDRFLTLAGFIPTSQRTFAASIHRPMRPTIQDQIIEQPLCFCSCFDIFQSECPITTPVHDPHYMFL